MEYLSHAEKGASARTPLEALFARGYEGARGVRNRSANGEAARRRRGMVACRQARSTAGNSRLENQRPPQHADGEISARQGWPLPGDATSPPGQRQTGVLNCTIKFLVSSF